MGFVGSHLCESLLKENHNLIILTKSFKKKHNGREPYNHAEGVASSYLNGWWRMGDGTENGSGTAYGEKVPFVHIYSDFKRFFSYFSYNSRIAFVQ